jgi:hypothetical protein
MCNLSKDGENLSLFGDGLAAPVATTPRGGLLTEKGLSAFFLSEFILLWPGDLTLETVLGGR